MQRADEQASRAVRGLVSRLPPGLVRSAGRWLMAGPRRRRVYNTISRTVRPTVPTRITHGALRGLLFSGGGNAGYALGASEPAVQQALAEHLRPGDVFYDVGANVGFLSLLGAKLVGSTGRVCCFEPLPSNISTLRLNLDRNGFSNYEVIEAAVSDASGTASLVVDRAGIRAYLTTVSVSRSLVPVKASSRVEVPLVRLDDLELPPPGFVKIDVEGAESAVLRGMRRLLREHRPMLIIELHGDEREPVESILHEENYATTLLADDGLPHLLATANGA